MLSTSIKFPIGRELRDHYNATVPSFPARIEQWGEIKDVDSGTADEVHPTNYAARRSTPAMRIQENMSMSNNGR